MEGSPTLFGIAQEGSVELKRALKEESSGNSQKFPWKFMGIFIIGALTLLAILAISTTIQQIILYFIRRETIWDYIIYSIVVVSLVLIIVWILYRYFPQILPADIE